MKLRWTNLMFITLTLMAFMVAACGGDGDDDGDAPSAARTSDDAAPTLAVATPADNGDDATPAGGDGNGTVTISAVNSNEFTKKEIEADAGSVTIVFDNQEMGVIHNIALYESETELSDPLGSTELTSGPDTQRLTLSLDEGEYYYNCQVHPNMAGTLEVG